MNGTNWVILAYAIGLGLLWGYAALLWVEARAAARAQGKDGGES